MTNSDRWRAFTEYELETLRAVLAASSDSDVVLLSEIIEEMTRRTMENLANRPKGDA